MSDTKLDIAFWNYDRTRPLTDGSVKIDGVNPSFHTADRHRDLREHDPRARV